MLRLLRERRPTTRLLAVVLLLRLGGAPGSADAMNLPAVPAPAPGTHGFAPVLPTMYWADLLGESPMPTEAPNPELVRRATDPRTCGLESGLGVYLTCGDGFFCTNIGNYRGCCATAGGLSQCSTNINTACLDYNASLTGGCDGIGLQTQCCGTSTRGACFTWLFTPLTAPGRTLTEWQCRSAPGVGILLDDPGLSTSSSRFTSGSGSTTGSPVTTSASGDPVEPGNGGEGGSSAPVGAIVGGVIGGLAVVGLGIVGAVLIVRRKKQQSQGVAMYSSVGGLGGYPPQGPPGGPGGGYAPPGAYYAPPPPSHSPGSAAASPYTPATTIAAGYPHSTSSSPPHKDPYTQWGGGGGYNPHPQQQQQGALYSGVAPPPQQQQAYGYYPGQVQATPNAELEGVPPLGTYGNRAELRG